MLNAVEGRVLGCLLEKERTTPDQYPLSQNALVLACNQSTAREPVMTVEADEVIGATTSLKAQGLVRLVHPSHGRSVTRFRQVADELHGWSSAQAAVISTLLLRGPQTLGEIRSRSERLYEFSSGSELDQVVAGLVAGDEPLVRLLERQPGQKESRWQQLLAEEDEPTSRQTPSRSVGDLTERVNELEARVSRLEAALADLLS